MSSCEQSGNMSQATFGVGGADVETSNSYESSTSQKQARWMPSSQSKGTAVPSASYSDELVNKQQEKDVPSVADIEKRRLTILKQRAQLLQQLEGLNVLLESLPQSKCNNEQLSHKTVQDNLSDNQEEPMSPAESADQQVEKTYSESEDENGSNYGSTSDGNVSDCVSEDTTDSEDCPAEDTACNKKEAGEEESTTQTNTEKPSETVVVPISHQKGKRIFDKKNYCLFCSKPVLKMSRHLTTIHSDRAEVAVAFQHPVHSKERTQIWKKLVKAGNFAHNKYVLQTGKGQLVVQARPTKPQKATDYVHCVYCFGNFAKKNVWRHMKTCSEKPEKANETKDKRSRLITQCAILTKNCENLSEGFKNVLCEMQYDDVTEAVIKDQILLQFGEQMFSEYSDDVKNHQYIRQNLRLVARLLLEAQKSTPMRTLENFFQPSNFKHVVSAVKSIAGYDPETKTFTTPSLAFKVGYNLQKICSVVEGTAVKYGDAKAEEACKIFQSLYQKKWNKHISSRAVRNLKETKKKNKDDAPFVEDVKRLHDHMEKVHRDAEEKLKENICSENYLALAKVVLAQILVFNKRKTREVTSISLTAFRSRKKSDVPGDIDVSVSNLEKTLCGFFSRVDIKGNCGRMLPVLLKPSFESAIELLISVREECGVPKDNPFVFGIPSPFPSTTLKKWVCTQIYVKECGAEKPAALTLPKLRQRFATMLPRIYLKEDEFRQIFGPKRQTQAVHGDAGVECDDRHHDLSSSLFGPECLGHKQETTTSSFTAEYKRKYGKALHSAERKPCFQKVVENQEDNRTEENTQEFCEIPAFKQTRSCQRASWCGPQFKCGTNPTTT
uniref:Si:dkey-51d8.9 n=1 Tax=Nothobranchius rachovii TaxID=451742 RepID=A0A1A8SM76_9TELE